MMKKLLLPLLLTELALPAAVQTCEISGRAGVGLMRFGGSDAQSVSFVTYINDAGFGYTNSPCGSRLGLAYRLR